jgi:S-layer homology domain
MSNLFKKVTSAVAGLAIVFSIVSPIAGVNAAYSSSLEAANKLASINVVKDNSANPADYRLGDTITRREVMKVAINLASCQSVALNTSYAGKFSDVPASDWAWKYAETAVDKGFVAANATFNPGRNVTKGEGLKMIMNVTKIDKASGGANFWADYVSAGVSAGIVDSFSDYDTIATRGWIFKVAANAIESGSCMPATDTGTGDLLDGLLDGVDTGTGTTSTGTTDTTPVTTNGGTVTVALSADTPAAATVPGAVKGLPVAAYDITAGAEDVTVTSLTLRRTGISDKDTLTALAAFTKDGRVSKGKNDDQNNDTEAQLTLTNGLVIKAGETKTIWVVADINPVSFSLRDEFAIELVEVTASANVTTEGSLVANTIRIGSVDAATLLVKRGATVSNPKLGAEGADIFKFDVKGAGNTDIILHSITVRADSSNAADDFANLTLSHGTTKVATLKAMNGKYATFDLGAAGMTIGQNKTEKFSVKADIVAGAADVIKFYVDKQLDVMATDTKFGYGANIDITDVDNTGSPVNDLLSSLTIQAGEVALVAVQPTATKIKENKKDVVLGQVKVTNVAGKNLELQKFGVKVALTAIGAGSFVDDGSGGGTAGDNIQNGTEGALKLDQTFENFKLVNEDTGASYTLDQATANSAISAFQDPDLNITLPQGTVTFTIKADTKNNIGNFNNSRIALSLATGTTTANGGFYVQETINDKPVTDLSPSSLSWNTVEGTESSGTLSLTPLANITKVRGSIDTVALQFEVKADDSSALTMDQAQIALRTTQANAAATNLDISQVALYKGSVSDANLVKKVSGSNLGAGVATFDGFNVDIAAGARQTFVVTVNIVDGTDPVTHIGIQSQVNALSLRDEDNNTVNITPSSTAYASNRTITVKDTGKLTATPDANNTDNVDVKTILGGTTKTVFSIDVQAQNETVDVDQVTFDVNADLSKAVVNASLYLGDTLIATNANSDITATQIKFIDLSTLQIPTSTSELKLALNTATIGFEKVGITTPTAKVTQVTFIKAKGVDSGKDLANADLPSGTGVVAIAGANSIAFAIVPAVVTPSVVTSFGTSADIKFTVDAGNNSDAAGNNSPSAKIVTLTFTDSGNSATITYKLKDANGNLMTAAPVASTGGDVVFTIVAPTPDTSIISSNRTYTIEAVIPVAAGNYTWGLKLKKDGISYKTSADGYTAALTSSATSTLSLGSSSKSN